MFARRGSNLRLLPDYLPGFDVQRAEVFLSVLLWEPITAWSDRCALLESHDVIKARDGAECSRVPISGIVRRAESITGRRRGKLWTAIRADAAGPRNLYEILGEQQFAI